MKARSFFALHLDRVMKVGPVVNTGLLVVTLSLTMARFVYWRGGELWMWVAGSAILTVVAILIFAHLWTNKFDMVRAARRASAIHDAPQVYQLVPFERVVWLTILLPQMRATVKILEKLGVDASEISSSVVLIEKWEKLGFVPREDYPEHLLQYYWHQEGPL